MAVIMPSVKVPGNTAYSGWQKHSKAQQFWVRKGAEMSAWKNVDTGGHRGCCRGVIGHVKAQGIWTHFQHA